MGSERQPLVIESGLPSVGKDRNVGLEQPSWTTKHTQMSQLTEDGGE